MQYLSLGIFPGHCTLLCTSQCHNGCKESWEIYRLEFGRFIVKTGEKVDIGGKVAVSAT